jgi:hypothetical protein
MSALRRFWSYRALATAAFVTFALPSLPRAEDTVPQQPTVTVLGTRDREILEQQVDRYVSHVITVPMEGALARWREPVCPLVGGLSREMGEYMLTKLSAFARDAKIDMAGEHCKPNFDVILTAKPDALLKAWAKRDPSIFGDAGGMQSRKFIRSTLPVRVWYNLQLEAIDGGMISTNSPALTAGAQAGGNTAFEGIPNVTLSKSSRLGWNVAHDLQSVIIVIDTTRAQNVSYGQLAAYIAMVGFIEVRPDADTGEAPTILSLFAGSPKPVPPGLSVWDEAILKSLYETEQTDKGQLLRIKHSVVREVLH